MESTFFMVFKNWLNKTFSRLAQVYLTPFQVKGNALDNAGGPFHFYDSIMGSCSSLSLCIQPELFSYYSKNLGEKCQLGPDNIEVLSQAEEAFKRI